VANTVSAREAHHMGIQDERQHQARPLGTLDGDGKGDHDQPFHLGRRPRASAPHPFSTRAPVLNPRHDPLGRGVARASSRPTSTRRSQLAHPERGTAGGDLIHSSCPAAELAVRAERLRLARDLHDSVAQTLYGIILGASRVLTLLERSETEAVHTIVSDMLRLANDSQTELRALVHELRSDESRQVERGLAESLASLTAAHEASGAIRVHLTLADEPDISRDAKQTLIRIAQEAIRNSEKHARASHVDLVLETHPSEVLLLVVDDGRGFDPDAVHPGHFGLQLMREQAIAVGASLDVISAPGRGTQVRVRVGRGSR
jgi:signal transduction histidine kinase